MTYRIVHISDIHLWRFPLNPLHWVGKRTLGLGNLLLRRGRKFRRERLPELIRAVDSDSPDHLILSGDLSTTSLDSEFEWVRAAFGDRLSTPEKATVLPGNHDRYTRGAWRRREFDRWFGHTTGADRYPFLKPLAPGLALIGFDPCLPRPISARGLAAPEAVEGLCEILRTLDPNRTRCLLFGCHYPGEVPEEHREREKGHEMVGARQVVQALAEAPIPIFWLHGHLHYPWLFASPTVERLVYLNPGAPLLIRNGVVPLGRWVLDWDGEELHTEWRSVSEAAAMMTSGA